MDGGGHLAYGRVIDSERIGCAGPDSGSPGVVKIHDDAFDPRKADGFGDHTLNSGAGSAPASATSASPSCAATPATTNRKGERERTGKRSEKRQELVFHEEPSYLPNGTHVAKVRRE